MINLLKISRPLTSSVKIMAATALLLFVMSQNAAAQTCQCVTYARCATGLLIYGNGNTWDNSAVSSGYRLAARPVIGAMPLS